MNKCKFCDFPTFDELCFKCKEKFYYELVNTISRYDLFIRAFYGPKKDIFNNTDCAKCGCVKTDNILCPDCTREVQIEIEDYKKEGIIYLGLKVFEKENNQSHEE